MAASLKLSAVRPDFESILLQLQLFLQAGGTWADLQTSSTGQTLMEMMAAIGAFNQFAIESAARETTLTTAARDSSIYAITRMLGVRIHRKYPASVSATLTRLDTSVSVAIAPFTQFSVNGQDFFTRNPTMFAQGSAIASERLYYGPVKAFVSATAFRLDIAGISVAILTHGDAFKMLVTSGGDYGRLIDVLYTGGNVGNDLFVLAPGEAALTDLGTVQVSLLRLGVSLHEGTIVQETFLSDGQPFKQVYLAEKSFNVSDVDVLVQVFNDQGTQFTTWSGINDGMWVASPIDNVYFDSTSGLGETILTFGDGVNGAVPHLGKQIRVTYAKTLGSSANNGLTNLQVGAVAYPWIEGKTTTVISGGADQKPSSYYRFMAPLIFKARNRGVTGTDYKAVSLDYPGVISASIMAQRDIAPWDLRWMNQIQICLLPIDVGTTQLSQLEWNEFLDYMVKKRHAAVHIVPKNPTQQLVDIEVTLAIKLQYVSSSVVPAAEAKIRALFARQSDTLGRRIAVSDVVRAAMVEGVDYVDVMKCKLQSSPTLVADLLPVDSTHFLALAGNLVNTRYSERDVYSDGSN